MKLTGGQLVVRALEEENVRFSFGIPGTHNIELYDVMAQSASHKPVLVTDEQSASFMADGAARASGGLAAVNVVPGAGLTHTMSGVAEAFMDRVPLLVLACGIRNDTHHAFQLHDIDQAAVLSPVCKEVFTPQTHRELYQDLRRACRLARKAPAGPVAVMVPANLYLFSEELGEDDFLFTGEDVNPPVDRDTARAIVDLLNTSQSVGIYAGYGAQDASEELVTLADKLDAIVYTTISGKGIFPEDNPRWAWNVMGAASPAPILKLEKKLDCLLAVGCRFGEVATASYGISPPANLIHIDIDPDVFDKNYKARISLVADARAALSAILKHAHLKEKIADRERLRDLARAHEQVRSRQLEGPLNQDKVSPARLLNAMQEKTPADTVYIVDSGNGMFIAMEQLRLKKPRCFMGPIDYSCMGYSVPAAIGAKLTCPDRTVVALVGDGAFLMTGLEMLTAVNYNVGVVFVILRDKELSQIAQFQQRALNRKTLTGLFPMDLEKMAQAVGMPYLALRNDTEVGAVLDRALHFVGEKKPVLVEANIDYSEATYFSRGVVKTNFLRFPWKDRLRLVGRVLKRKVF